MINPRHVRLVFSDALRSVRRYDREQARRMRRRLREMRPDLYLVAS